MGVRPHEPYTALVTPAFSGAPREGPFSWIGIGTRVPPALPGPAPCLHGGSILGGFLLPLGFQEGAVAVGPGWSPAGFEPCLATDGLLGRGESSLCVHKCVRVWGCI